MSMKYVVTNMRQLKYLQPMQAIERIKVGGENGINIYPDVQYQTIKGFGGAFTESSGYNFANLSDHKKNEIVQAYFGETGIGYTLGRTHINSCDFALGNYAYTDESDTELKKFNRDRDRKYIVPFIHAAQKATKTPITFLASPWSPPAFMKTNGEMNNGGQLKDEFRELWAEYIAKYIIDCKNDGIDISMITVQNEPDATQTWDSCRYTAEEEMVFVRDYLGPILEQNQLQDVKIYIWDHNKEIIFERAREILQDKKANSYIAGTAFHWYSGDHFDGVALVKEKYPEKELLFTEGCVEFSRFDATDEIYQAEMYAHDILGNLNAGMNGFIDWNLLLDERGGPNHVGNFCAAPIMCNAATDSYEKKLSFYYIGHFSKYILPGARRIATTRYSDNIEVTAFVNPNGERVVVLLNKRDKDIDVTLREYGMGYKITVNAHSIVTLCYDNMP